MLQLPYRIEDGPHPARAGHFVLLAPIGRHVLTILTQDGVLRAEYPLAGGLDLLIDLTSDLPVLVGHAVTQGLRAGSLQDCCFIICHAVSSTAAASVIAFTAERLSKDRDPPVVLCTHRKCNRPILGLLRTTLDPRAQRGCLEEQQIPDLLSLTKGFRGFWPIFL